LVGAGALTADALGPFLADTRAPLGRRLVAANVVTNDQLLSALRLQVRRRLHRLFFIEGGTFTLLPGAHDRGVEAGTEIRVDPLRGIYQALRSGWSEARFGMQLAVVGGRSLKLVAGADQLFRYGLAEPDHAVIRLLQERPMPISELMLAP